MTGMDIMKELAVFKKAIDRELETILDEVIAETKKKDRFIASVLTYFKKTVLAGGKRLRPALLYYGYRAAGGKNRAAILRAAASIELVHAFMLMHDDIVDRDDLRHGMKTVHARYRTIAGKIFPKKDAAHFSFSLALVLGDFVYAFGNRVLFSTPFPPYLIVRALKRLQEIVSLTWVGETQDVYMEYRGKASEKEILSMYENKTARYTFEGPLQLGAILAGAPDSFLEKISAAALPLGIAFQIYDDILGIFGSEKEIGKPVGSDIREGKITLLAMRARKKSNRAERAIIDDLLGKENLSRDDLERFRSVMISTGALADVKNMAHDHVAQGKRHLMRMRLPREPGEFLLGVADYLSARTK